MANSLISIPEYFTRFIDPSVDLNRTPKICCPFHEEDTPSFSYSTEKGVWRCFGACKAGGDVVALHKQNYKLRTRKEAEDSLYKILGLEVNNAVRVIQGRADERAAAFEVAYAKALLVCKTVDDWDGLDYIMGQYPQDINMLETFYNCRK